MMDILSSSREVPNPLRPYYVPPSIGISSGSSAGASAARDIGSTASSTSPSLSPKPSFGTAARDLLSDIDYEGYLPAATPSAAGLAKRLFDQAAWKYTSVLLAQPFEVARTVLQCHTAAAEPSRAPPEYPRRRRGGQGAYRESVDHNASDEDSDADLPSYFTASSPSPPVGWTRSIEGRRRTLSRSHSHTPTPSAPRPSYKLELRRRDSVLEVLSQLWAKEGAWGTWKGTNATFVYGVLLKTIENWTRSLLSALINLPDPGLSPSMGVGVGGLDIVDTPSSLASLGVAVAAAGIAGLLLAPVDIIRTRLILTPISSPPRAILPSLRHLESWTCPLSLLPVTLLHSTLPTFFSASIPLALRSLLNVDPVVTPASYSVATFLASTAELFLRLPFETVLRRGQVDVLKQQQLRVEQPEQATALNEMKIRLDPQRSISSPPGPLRTVVDVGPFYGVFGTMWAITHEENVLRKSSSKNVAASQHPGTQAMKVETEKGFLGLWRGWKVGFWGLVGVWGVAALGRSGGGEF